ncbi:DUF4259 domain-containing protein [Curtobacterium sp. Csp2]|nr:DUF4259 domain-containing protein [Curtobacterium sp. Csp2]
MGTWSAEPVGNDDAADFVAELDGQQRWTVVKRALARAERAGEGLDSDDAAVAVAAAEVVAHGLGRPSQTDAYTEDVQDFVGRARRPTRTPRTSRTSSAAHADRAAVSRTGRSVQWRSPRSPTANSPSCGPRPGQPSGRTRSTAWSRTSRSADRAAERASHRGRVVGSTEETEPNHFFLRTTKDSGTAAAAHTTKAPTEPAFHRGLSVGLTGFEPATP